MNSEFDNNNVHHENDENLDKTYRPEDSKPASQYVFRPTTSYTYQSNPAPITNQSHTPYTPPQPTHSTSTVSAAANKPKFSFLTLIVCLIVTAVISASVSVVITSTVLANKQGSGDSSESIKGGNQNITITDNTDNYVVAVTQKVQPSVVGVVSKYRHNTNNLFGNNSDELESEGSGVIYSSDGYIITNKHVVDYAISYGGSLEVYFNGDTENAVSAQIVGYDAAYDLAVIKVSKSGLSAISIGSSSDLTVGQNVVAVGNPGGLQFMGSISVGYVSGLSRNITIDSFEMELIQTDAAINPGNSGGALVDSEGKLVGITNSKIVSEDFEGMGFAIPVDTVVDICNDIIANRDEPKPYIGVQINTAYTADYLKSRGLPEGLVVASVIEGGPAQKAGIKQYDIITKIDGQAVSTYSKLVNIIHKHKIGDEISVTVFRNGESIELKLIATASNG